MRLTIVCLALAIGVSACSLPLPSRDCGAPTIYPKSQPVTEGVKYTPVCRGGTLDFDGRLWFPRNNEDAPKLCSPGDTVTLADHSHINYVRTDGSVVQFGPPAREQRLGCA